MRRRVQRVHFVGVGGVGMSGIAEILHVTESRISQIRTQALRRMRDRLTDRRDDA